MTEDPVERSRRLDVDLGEDDPVAHALGNLRTYGRRNRTIAVALTIVVLIVSLVAWSDHNHGNRLDTTQHELQLAVRRLNEVAGEAAKNRNNVKQSCESGNQSRRDQRQLWDFILTLPPSRKPTTDAEQRRQAQQKRDFVKFLDTTFQPRDCSRPDPFAPTPTTTAVTSQR